MSKKNISEFQAILLCVVINVLTDIKRQITAINFNNKVI